MALANFPLLSSNSRHFSPPSSTTLPINDRYFSNHPLNLMLEKFKNPIQIKQIHAQFLRTGLFFDPYSSSNLLSSLVSTPICDLSYAHQVFDEMPEPNLYSWNTMIRVYAVNEHPLRSLMVFNRMLCEFCGLPNKFTFPFVVKAISEVVDECDGGKLGKGVHGMVIKLGLDLDLYILNSLVRFYGVCGCLDSAYRVFMRIGNKDVVSWNSMINAYVQRGCPKMALEMYKEMERENVRPNELTMVGVFSACSKTENLGFGKMLHLYVRNGGIKPNLMVMNAMLEMYVKCGSMEDAEKLFNEMEEKDVVSWTTMVVGYAKLGKFIEANRFFRAMPFRDIASWNALISAYEKNDKPKEALEIFRELLALKSPKPDEVTLVCALLACAKLGASSMGNWIHVYIKKHGIKLNSHLCTSLIDMFSKCGDLDKALEVFNLVKKKDVYAWSAMIAGLSMHGHGKDAIDLFSRMRDSRVKPNDVTFINVLGACSHSGLVEEGKLIFKQMNPIYGVKPQTEHYSCMIDILSRVGHFKEAMDLINKMSEMGVPHTPSVWLSLLGGCYFHGNIELAEFATTRLLELDPNNDGAYVSLSNLHAKSGNWDKVAELRKVMKVYGLKKEPGCSSIEVNGTIHEFFVADNSHPMCKEIYDKLDEIGAKLKEFGYVIDESHVLQVVEEENMKEHSLFVHSEKLAIAFGLLTLEPGQPIRIVKNIRVCGDCHSFAKMVSKVYDQKIILRDRFRFHHFEDGCCSCMEYW